jgi:hypothetical protein
MSYGSFGRVTSGRVLDDQHRRLIDVAFGIRPLMPVAIRLP